MSEVAAADAYGPAADPVAPSEDIEPRCWRCNRMLAKLLTRPWHIDCPRCHAHNSGVIVH